jgi:hypothetical protein
MTPADRFHAHLDGCVRCRTTPFSLCAEGRVLLHLAARAPRFPRKENEK